MRIGQVAYERTGRNQRFDCKLFDTVEPFHGYYSVRPGSYMKQ